MKRITVLSFVFMILLSVNAYAAGWQWVTSNDVCSLYIDSYNVNFSFNSFFHETYIDCYAKYENAEEDENGVSVGRF